MSILLNDVLTLAGQLDDSPGFDTPRERFRRFLVEHAGDTDLIRSLIEQCQHSPGGQHRRALQDLVVVLGSSLGFETTFAPYVGAQEAHSDPAQPAARADGHWRSRPGLHVVLEIRSDEPRDYGLESLSAAIVARATFDSVSVARILGLFVITPLHAGAHRLEEALEKSRPDVPLRLVSLRALLTLAGLVHHGHVTHDEVVRLFGSALSLDSVISMVERVAGAGDSPDTAPREVPPEQTECGYWMAVVTGDRAATPEQFVELVVGRRHILGVGETGAHAAVRPGDWLCFHIPQRGVVGHAQVASIAADGAGVREAHRFSSVIRLAEIALHLESPAALDPETELRHRAVHRTSAGAPPYLIRLSRREFMEVAASRRQAAPAAPGEPLTITGGDSRSRG